VRRALEKIRDALRRELAEHGVLVREVVIERARSDARPLGDGLRRGRRVAALRELSLGGFNERRTRALRARLHGDAKGNHRRHRSRSRTKTELDVKFENII